MDYRLDGKLDGSHLIDRKTKFHLEDILLSQFDNSLNNYNDWTSFKRDIRLNALLDEKRIQFDIDDINVWGRLDDSMQSKSFLSDGVAFVVKSMSFIIKGDFVQELEITWRPLTTYDGRCLLGLIEADIPVDIEMKFIDNQFYYFHVS